MAKKLMIIAEAFDNKLRRYEIEQVTKPGNPEDMPYEEQAEFDLITRRYFKMRNGGILRADQVLYFRILDVRVSTTEEQVLESWRQG